MSDAAPLVVEPVVGWRLWHVLREREGYRLASWSRSGRWPAGARMEARCRRFLGRGCDEAPRLGHSCGIYAVRSRERAAALLDELPPLPGPVALGRVSLWGRVVENTHGWRAQFAYPYDVELVGGGGSAAVAAALRGAYAVDVSSSR